MRSFIAIIVLYGFFSQISIAQRQNQTETPPGLILDLPIFDFPYQRYAANATGNFFKGYANPSMSQSLAMSNNLYASVHHDIKRRIKPKNKFVRILLQNGIAAGVDYVSLFIPFGMPWLHEEYHRAVLSRREINSFNEVNTFPFGKSQIYVKKINDDDLIRLSNNHMPDFIRLQSAGLEAQYHQIQTLQKQNFYYNQGLPHVPFYWLSTINNIFYVYSCTSAESFDQIIDEANKKEKEIASRDFTGPDFTAWTSALFNPNRPYQARGIHPSGIGINRYIKPSDLNQEELAYLQKQGNLQLLNLLSPHLFGFPRIKLKSAPQGNYFGNIAVRHTLTSFGNDVSLDLFYQTPKNNFFFTLHNFNNLNASFWGVEAGIIDKQIFQDKLLFSGRSIIWTQPKDQSFTTNEGSFGGLLSLRSAYKLGEWLPYIELEGKTNGWAMGNVFLEENVSLRCGLSFRIK